MYVNGIIPPVRPTGPGADGSGIINFVDQDNEEHHIKIKKMFKRRGSIVTLPYSII